MKRLMTCNILLFLSIACYAYEPVNTQVTDAVTQTNVKVVAEAPAQAMGMVYQSLQNCDLVNQTTDTFKVNRPNHNQQTYLRPYDSMSVQCVELPPTSNANPSQYLSLYSASTSQAIQLIYNQRQATITSEE